MAAEDKIWYRYTCPHCGQEENCKPLEGYSYRKFEDRPHENPSECIFYLRSIIDDLVSDVKRLKYPDEY